FVDRRISQRRLLYPITVSSSSSSTFLKFFFSAFRSAEVARSSLEEPINNLSQSNIASQLFFKEK
ncbi:hypothetical protein, partial [Saccharibacillus sp. JS10]|uniref:hypothetical protein n=1 Tax=Saccharibacillus sp. JS10 TaxID=2950552 RepID=UPI00210B681A